MQTVASSIDSQPVIERFGFEIRDGTTLTKQNFNEDDSGKYTCEIEYSDMKESYLYMVQVKKQGKNIDLKKIL